MGKKGAMPEPVNRSARVDRSIKGKTDRDHEKHCTSPWRCIWQMRQEDRKVQVDEEKVGLDSRDVI